MNKTLLILFILICPYVSFGQADEQFKPQVFGTMKFGYEVDTEDGYNRFSVKNARAGVRGKLNKHVGYFFQTDINAQSVNPGTKNALVVLDSYAELFPADNLSVMAGQMALPFAEAYVITPGQMMFANMSYIFPEASAQARDIGIRANYKNKINTVPVELQVGAFNGSNINTPTWETNPTVSGRLLFGTMKGFRTSLKYFSSHKANKRVNALGFDLRYATDRWKIEAEFNQLDSLDKSNATLGSYFLQGGYSIPAKNQEGFIKYYMPTGRIESIGNKIFDNGFAYNRFTAGINFGIDVRPMKGEIRLNYEKVFRRSATGTTNIDYIYNNIRDPRGYHDKFVVDILINF